MPRFVAISFTVIGIFTAVMWLLSIIGICNWGTLLPDWDPTLITITLAIINLAGLIYLVAKRRYYPRWMVIAGAAGNGLSLVVNSYSMLGYLFLKHIFRM